MGRRPAPLDPDHPLGAFALELKALRDAAGSRGACRPTCERAGFTRATYYAWLSGKQLPERDALQRAVKFWGGDAGYWNARRRQAEIELGQKASTQERTSASVSGSGATHILPEKDSGDLTSLRVAETRQVLAILGFRPEQANERSAHFLLALLQIGPSQPWRRANMPLLKVTEALEWIRSTYQKAYAPNSRETFRRFTLHQFIEAGLVIPNPDNPNRPVNSPMHRYQISRAHHDLLMYYGQEDFWRRLAVHFRSSPFPEGPSRGAVGQG